MTTRASRKTPSSAVGYDYSQGYGPALDGPGRGGGRPSGYPGGNQRAPQLFGTQPSVPVGFVEAIGRFYAKYAQFSGRASRSEYWWATLYLLLVSVALQALIATIGTSPTGETTVGGLLMTLLSLAFSLGNLVPSVAVCVRRLHDIDLSGWFWLLGFIPIVGGLVLLVLLVLPPKPQGARFDR